VLPQNGENCTRKPRRTAAMRATSQTTSITPG